MTGSSVLQTRGTKQCAGRSNNDLLPKPMSIGSVAFLSTWELSY